MKPFVCTHFAPGVKSDKSCSMTCSFGSKTAATLQPHLAKPKWLHYRTVAHLNNESSRSTSRPKTLEPQPVLTLITSLVDIFRCTNCKLKRTAPEYLSNCARYGLAGSIGLHWTASKRHNGQSHQSSHVGRDANESL